MQGTTVTKLDDGTEITIREAFSATSYRREERYAYKAAAVINLTIERTDDLRGYYVRFSKNRGNGWMRARVSVEKFTTEQAARAWADGRWSKLLAWVQTVTPITSTWQPDFTCHPNH